MKKYVFIVPTVANIGGAQMYIRNKVLWLRQYGWEVDVILAQSGAAKLSELQVFNFVVPELAFNILNYSGKKKAEVIQKIVGRIGLGRTEETVIESTCISESSWAEAVASRVGAKHISFLLQEENTITNKGMREFFVFKHNRRELVGIADSSLMNMFELFHSIPKEKSYRLPAHCTNVQADVDSPFISIVADIKKDYIVGLLSRLDKPFVMSAVYDFCQYAKTHRNKEFLFLIMGDAPRGSEILEQIRELFNKQTNNVRIIATGYLYPVPTRLLELCDAFFSSAGSSWVCKSSGVPTITIDGNDFKPIGVLGRTTNNSLFREDEPILDFASLMDDILFRGVFIKEEPSYQKGLFDYSDHLSFISDSSSVKEYFDVESIKPETITDYKLKWALSVIGPENYLKLGLLKERWIRRR